MNVMNLIEKCLKECDGDILTASEHVAVKIGWTKEEVLDVYDANRDDED